MVAGHTRVRQAAKQRVGAVGDPPPPLSPFPSPEAVFQGDDQGLFQGLFKLLRAILFEQDVVAEVHERQLLRGLGWWAQRAAGNTHAHVSEGTASTIHSRVARVGRREDKRME